MSKTKIPAPASGVYAALATPRRPNSIDADAAAFLEYLDKVSSGGVDGFVLFGSTGEFVHFDIEERMRVVSLAVKRSRVPALVNVSHSTLAGAVQLMQQAMDAGAAGVLIMPPYFFRYADEEIARFYQAFVEAADGQLPIYLYNLPFFTNPISTKLAEQLLGSGAFAGIKDSSGDWESLESLRKIREHHSFQLLIGNESVYLRGLIAGANGIVSGVAAALPELPVEIHRAMRASDLSAAKALAARLDELVAWISKFPPTVAIKQIAEARGWMRADLANPLGPNAVADLQLFRAWVAKWLPATPVAVRRQFKRANVVVVSDTTVSNGSKPIAQMSPEEFRVAAHRHADWIAEYFNRIRDLPVATPLGPGQLIESLPKEAPEAGQSIDTIFADFQTSIFPALTLWNHPRFFAYFSVSSTPPSILADFLAATLNVNAMLWKSSPGATELEQVALGWLRQWLGFDESWFGIIYDTASVGVMQAIGAAREWIAPECRLNGMRGDLTVYISEHTHSSSEKAAITLGFGQENVRRIPVDGEFRMRPDLLEAAIEKDIASHKRPCCIVASVGSTSTSAIDPVPEIAEVAERYGAWLHVDAAYGGSAAVLPEMRSILTGAERAHSVILNPHKWLYVSIDCSVLYTRFPEILRRASSLSAEYLRTPEDDRVVNYMDYGVQLGRRFRALKLWYVFRYYGRQGIVSMLRESLRLAQILKSLIENDNDFELSAPVPLSLVCFRYRGENDFNRRLLANINTTGAAFLSHTVLNGEFVLRFAIGNFQTTEQDVRETWGLIRATARQLAEVAVA